MIYLVDEAFGELPKTSIRPACRQKPASTANCVASRNAASSDTLRTVELSGRSSRRQKKTVRTITILDGLFSVASCDLWSNRRKNRQINRLAVRRECRLPINQRLRQTTAWRDDAGRMINETSRNTLPFLRYPFRRLPEYATPLLPLHHFERRFAVDL